MEISEKGLALIKEFEGLHLTAYQDEVGVWTIGYGITNSDKSITRKTIKKGLKITKEKAEEWLEECLNVLYAPKIMKYDVRYNWNQNEFDAMISFAYNIGSIDQLTANGSRSKSVISNKLLEYNKAGGKVYNGLTRRRKAERDLFLTPVPKEPAEEERKREPGTNYFSELKNKAVTNITEFLHNRGLGAGTPNLSKIAALNCDSPEVKAALFALAQNGILKKPDGLNKWKK